MIIRLVRSIALVAVATLFAFAGCSGGDSSGPGSVSVDAVSIAGAPANLQIGSSVTASAQAKDASGAVLAGKTFVWSSNASSVATVGQDGTITAVGLGQATISATTEGKSGSVVINVIPVAVAAVIVSIPASELAVGETTQATVLLSDAAGRALTGRAVTWSSSQPAVAAVDSTGKVTAISPGGPVSIIANSEGVAGGAQVSVIVRVDCASGSLQVAVGEIRILAGAERSSFCLSAGSQSEFLLMPFNRSAVAANTASLQLIGANTSGVLGASVVSGTPQVLPQPDTRRVISDEAFRTRERADLRGSFTALRRVKAETGRFPISRLTGMPSTPAPGDVYQVNVNLSGNSCSGAKVLRGARVVSVSSKVIVMLDTQSPSDGYTDSELIGFAETFENAGYAVTTSNFGTPTDIDGNGRVVILFTPAVNALSTQSAGIVGGLQASRDLFPVSTCVGSNEGEMFYMPVPDPLNTINSKYTVKSSVSRSIQGTLSHELQHLVNAGRRIYVNDALAFEEVWLNEGLSHIAEELVYYHASGNTPRLNIDLQKVQSSQAQLDAINRYQVNNLGRLLTYLEATETNSPYAANDNLETRGATWELLRYAADRKGGDERETWFALANSRTSGQDNFAAAFGPITSMTRDWAIAQYFDDMVSPLPPTYSYPSWNFRSLLPAINNGVFPLVTRSLAAAPIDISLAGGGVAYVRFRVNAGGTASISANSSGLAPVGSIDLILVRTQ